MNRAQRRNRWGWIVVAATVTAFAAPTTSQAGPSSSPVVIPLPASRGGAFLIGKPFPNLPIVPKHQGVTLYRWWTDSCPYCQSTLPALERLRLEFGERLNVVAVYHPKPKRAVKDEEVARWAVERGFHGRVTVDADWSNLEAVWPDAQRVATSVSVLTDRQGIIRFVHPGPDYFPSTKPEDARQNADYEALRQAITVLVSAK